MLTSDDVIFRECTPDDKAFIFASWLRSYRQSDFAKDMSNTDYYDNHKVFVERLLKRSYVSIACNPNDPDQIYGFIAFELEEDINTLIHYIYVKQTYRKFGLGKLLFNIAQPDSSRRTICSALPTAGKSGLMKKFNCSYNLYKII